MSTFNRWLFISLFGYFTASSLLADPATFFHPLADIPLTGGVSRFDYQSLDPDKGTLYISHMGAGQIIVFNTKQNKVSETLNGFPGVTGVLVLPEIHRLYASVTRSHQVMVLDTMSLKVIAKIPAGRFPDGMAYAPDQKKLYVSDEKGGEVTVIDVDKNQRITSIKMGGEVGNVRYETNTHMILALVQSRNELAVIDPRTDKIANRYLITGGKHPHSLCLDPNSHLAFIGCDGDEKLIAMDLDHFQEIGVSDMGRDPDVMAFDSNFGFLYAASESGLVSIFKVRDRMVMKIGDFPVGENAHTVAVDPNTHLVYFPLRKVNKGPVLRIMKPSN